MKEWRKSVILHYFETISFAHLTHKSSRERDQNNRNMLYFHKFTKKRVTHNQNWKNKHHPMDTSKIFNFLIRAWKSSHSSKSKLISKIPTTLASKGVPKIVSIGSLLLRNKGVLFAKVVGIFIFLFENVIIS